VRIEPGGFLSRAECQFQPEVEKHKRESDRARSAGGDTTEYQKGQPSGP